MSNTVNKASTTTDGQWHFSWGSETERTVDHTRPASVTPFSSQSTIIRRDATNDEDMLVEVRAPSVEEKVKIIMSLNWASGKLGAAYYDCSTCQLYALTDTVDVPPEFLSLQKVIRLTNPVTVIVSTKQDDQFLQKLKQTVTDMERESLPTTSTDTNSTTVCLCPEVLLMPSIDFEVGGCRSRIMNMAFPGMPKFDTNTERAIFMSSLIDFSNTVAIRALGSLLRYLDRKRISVELEDNAVKTPIACLNVVTLQDIVMVDRDTYRALQIFCPEWHPSVYKLASGTKEGLSLYGIFNQCKSTLGSREMQLLFLQPTLNMEVLQQRHLAIRFFTNPTNIEVVTSLQNYLKHIKNVSTIIARTANGATSIGDWHSLYKTTYNAVLIANTVKHQPQNIEIFQNIAVHFTNDLLQIASLINRMVDFEESFAQRRVVVKFGVDETLDEKKRTYNGLPHFLNLVARQEITRLDSRIEECSVIYLPQLGYLLSVPVTETMRATKNYNMPDLDFVFVSNDAVYYKSASTKELDRLLGDIKNDIFDLEARIISRLQNLVLESTAILLNVMKYAAKLDCLIAMAVIAKEFSYVEPELTLDTVIDIKDGRHPLQELCVNTFVSNSTASGGPHGKLKIITGPNASGKSVYLKQVALIVFMAHIGSFVPAQSATIGLVDGIFSRIHTMESISSGLSTYQIDLNQMSFASRCATEKSLIVIDEFGKGTGVVDGMALLASCINHWLSQEETSPHVFVSTHIYGVAQWLDDSQQLKYQMMEVGINDQELVYFYRLVEGRASCSFACHVGRKAGVREDVLDVALDVRNRVNESKPVLCQEDIKDWFLEGYQQVADEFMKIDWDATDDDTSIAIRNLLKIVCNMNPN